MGVVQTQQRFPGQGEIRGPKTGRWGVQVVQTRHETEGRTKARKGLARAEITQRPAESPQRAAKTERAFRGTLVTGPSRIRTLDQGIMSPVNPTVQAELAPEGAQEGASDDEPPLTAPGLAQVTTAWANLPDHIRAAILTLVNSAKEAKR